MGSATKLIASTDRCINEPTFPVSINRAQDEYFRSSRRIRVLDKGILYLFWIVMEALSVMLEIGVTNSFFGVNPQSITL